MTSNPPNPYHHLKNNKSLQIILSSSRDVEDVKLLRSLIRKVAPMTYRQSVLVQKVLSFYWGCSPDSNIIFNWHGNVKNFLEIAEFFSDEEGFDIIKAEYHRSKLIQIKVKSCDRS